MSELGRRRVRALTGWSLGKITEVHDRIREEVAARVVELHLEIDPTLPDRRFEQACGDAISRALEWFSEAYLEPLDATDPKRAREIAAYGMILPDDVGRLYQRVVELLTESTHPNSGRVLAIVLATMRERFEA